MAIQETTDGERHRQRRYPTGFPVRCTEAEKQEIFARAESVNRSASRFLVELALLRDGTGVVYRQSPEELSAVEGLIVQLRRLASNLNELARGEHVSAHDGTDAPSAAEVGDAVQEVRRVLDQLRSRLL